MIIFILTDQTIKIMMMSHLLGLCQTLFLTSKEQDLLTRFTKDEQKLQLLPNWIFHLAILQFL